MFARFDENPAMTLRVIKETKRYGRTDGCTDGRTHGRTDGRTDNVKTVYPLQTKFAGGIIISLPTYPKFCCYAPGTTHIFHLSLTDYDYPRSAQFVSRTAEIHNQNQESEFR